MKKVIIIKSIENRHVEIDIEISLLQQIGEIEIRFYSHLYKYADLDRFESELKKYGWHHSNELPIWKKYFNAGNPKRVKKMLDGVERHINRYVKKAQASYNYIYDSYKQQGFQ